MGLLSFHFPGRAPRGPVLVDWRAIREHAEKQDGIDVSIEMPELFPASSVDGHHSVTLLRGEGNGGFTGDRPKAPSTAREQDNCGVVP
jgi:hypothetical protein